MSRAATTERRSPSRARVVMLSVLGVVVIVAIVALARPILERDEALVAPEAVTAGAQNTPPPWYYDAQNNRHWHPDHAHWHDGPPPLTGGDAVPAPSSVETPEPYQYDEATDRHFDPVHGHWHTGRPPVGPDSADAPDG